MTKEELLNKYFAERRVMQIASLGSDGSPWLCTVFFVEHDSKLYWLSHPERRHSEDIARDARIAVAIVGEDNWPVSGVQATGTATAITDIKTATKIMPKYIKKYGQGKDFVELLKRGTNKHQLYEFSTDTYKIFDEVYFKDSPEQYIGV
jgi:uncharacterized protein YhbP (UPF0306 family)